MEPRSRSVSLPKRLGNHIFLGGTPEFDLWYYSVDGRGHALRIVDSTDEWDEWPVDKLPPKGRGYFKDITLTPEEEESIETYLRCFAPWVLGTNLTEESNDV